VAFALPAYPVRVEGRLDPQLSRWLWLVKWILAIPHYIVLAFLWIAFFVLSVVAFFAILFTARYPRGIFEFNVGVLRWTWRVGFYTFGANGTDRYPPFTLRPTDYPAELSVEYPEQLSRALVLVKWWLLAIPHYLVLAVVVGGAGWGAWQVGHSGWDWNGGLVELLVLIAAVALLVTGRYPRGIFDLVLGLDRWAIRVAAYAALMTDRYPPFRLDMGATEDGTGTAAAAVAAPGEPPPRPAAGGSQSLGAGRIVLLVAGSLLALVSLAVLVGGAAVVAVDQTQRDRDGFVMSPTERFATDTPALVSEPLDIRIDEAPDWVASRDLLGTVRIRSVRDRPVFLGIAPARDVDRYLAGVRHEEVHDLGTDAPYVLRPGSRDRLAPPARQDFWSATAQGTGEQVLDWRVTDGDWRVVLMTPSGTPDVDADLSIGARLSNLVWWGIGLLLAGAVLAAVAATMTVLAVHRDAEPAAEAGTETEERPTEGGTG
jgi:hypothetical protein